MFWKIPALIYRFYYVILRYSYITKFTFEQIINIKISDVGIILLYTHANAN